MILIFKGPGTTRVIPNVTEIGGFDFVNEKLREGGVFGWQRSDPKGDVRFGLMSEFFAKRFTHIALIGGPGKSTHFGENLLWIHGDGWMLSPGVHDKPNLDVS